MSDENDQGLGELEGRLAYGFRDRSLLERALTHRSWAHEQTGPGEGELARSLHNEALEFVGDSVLGLVVADRLFRDCENMTEGDLSRMKHRLVSTETLARAAARLDLGSHVRVGRGEEKTGGRRKQAMLADLFEAVLAAVYLDGGFEAAQNFVGHALSEELDEATPESAAAADYKTLLQERVQAVFRVTPAYEMIETEGPPHDRTFHVEVRWNETSIRGTGSSIKSAEMDAARRALEEIEELNGSGEAGAEEASPTESDDGDRAVGNESQGEQSPEGAEV
ncbi:MAG TPA: ribonuclease III [Pyrinomonadaceae bacterium]|nr:ribonuclease III [Pyrinomonadaceae bacterium]